MTATLYPFDFRVGGGGLAGSETFSFDERQLTDIDDNLFNVVLFLPLGALVYASRWRRPYRVGGSILLAGVAGALISSVIEYLQTYLPGRDSSLVDVVSNAAGAAIGAIGYGVAGGVVAARVASIRAHDSTAVLAGTLLAFTVVALAMSALLQLRSRLSNWSEYPLLVGNEYTGDRPWEGRIIALELTDAATPHEAVDAFSAGRAQTLPGYRLAAFDFAGEPPFRDAAGRLPDLESSGSGGTSGSKGFVLGGASWLHTSGPATAIAERVRESNAFTLLVRCATDDVNQTGPARIVSNSRDTASRNFTLGQRGSAIVFRLRTPHTGPNGDRPELVIPDAFSSHEPRDILVTYDGAVLQAAVAGSGRVSRMELSPGSSVVALRLLDFATSYFRLPAVTVRADAMVRYKLTYLAVVSLFAGGLVGVLGRSLRQQRDVCLIWALSFALLLEGTLIVASGRFFDWRSLFGHATVSVLVSLTGALVVSALMTKPLFVRRDSAQVLR